MIKLSIIIPVYNTEKYLHRCIESVLRQKKEWLELIIVDDGSNDVCADMCVKSSPNLCVNSSFSYVVLSTLLLSSRDLTEWSLVYHNTLSYQRFYDLHSIHYDHLEGLHQLI